MPEQIKINNNTYLIYDFDRGRGPGMADLRNTRNDFINSKEKPYVVISNPIEGEIHFAREDEFLTELHTYLREYDSNKCILVMGDANLTDNYTRWCKTRKEQKVFKHTIYYPYKLLMRTINHFNAHPIRAKHLPQKYKHFVSMNAAAKPHRFHMIEKLFSNGWNTKGYITYLNRYGENTKHMANENFQGQTLTLDFDGKQIDQGQNQEVLPKEYKQAVFDIVNESIISDTSLFLTEKTWKPILYKNPFIILGSKGTCRHLQNFWGIKLYNDIINYSFDYVTYPQRLHRMVEDNLRPIMSMHIDELNNWLNSKSTQDKLSYNQEKLLTTKCESLYDFVDKHVHG